MNTKDKTEAFKASCRVYRNEKNELEHMLGLHHSAADEMFYNFLDDDVAFVEDTFDAIEEKCGTAARVMVWLLFVEEMTQTDVAEKYGITRRQVQVSLYKWMKEVFPDD